MVAAEAGTAEGYPESIGAREEVECFSGGGFGFVVVGS